MMDEAREITEIPDRSRLNGSDATPVAQPKNTRPHLVLVASPDRQFEVKTGAYQDGPCPPDPGIATRQRGYRTLALLGLLLVLAALLYGGMVGAVMPRPFYGMDKIYHLLGFAALAVSVRLVFPRGGIAWQSGAMLGLGGGIELVQMLEPWATASVWDFLFDGIGVALGILLARLPLARRYASWITTR